MGEASYIFAGLGFVYVRLSGGSKLGSFSDSLRVPRRVAVASSESHDDAGQHILFTRATRRCVDFPAVTSPADL